MTAALKAPFPWFGGKSAVAADVWARIGDVANYVEPFAGSCAVLLARPQPFSGVETVNDLDGLLANFWRALKWAPREVAEHADWPVNEADLHARHLWLVGQRESLTERLMGDPMWFDAQAAGWWAWGACSWIGTGWCSGRGPWTTDGTRIMRRSEALADAGHGINRQLPHLGDAGQGINRQLPHLGNAGQGINRRIKGDDESGAGRVWAHIEPVAARMRDVRVACGDWRRVCGDNVLFSSNRGRGGAAAGAFLDPPYDEGVGYSVGGGVAAEAWDWAVERGANPALRIVVCGYEDGRDVPSGWTVVEWKAQGGYGLQGDGEGRANAHRERLWCSPGCLDPGGQMALF